MKLSLCFLLAALCCASVFGLRISSTDGIFSFAPQDLYAPLEEVLKEIEIEKNDGLSRLSDAKSDVEYSKNEQISEEAKLNASSLAAVARLSELNKAKLRLATREQEYSTNDNTRSQEEAQLKKISSELTKMGDAGPADGRIGTLPASSVPDPVAKLEAMKLVAEAAERLLQTRPEAKTIINAIQRKSQGASTIMSQLTTLQAAITSERKEDTAAVDKYKTVVTAATLKYQDAEALRVTKTNTLAQGKIASANALSVLKYQQEEFQKAQVLRDQDIATIKQAISMVKDLVANTAAKKASSTSLIQLMRQSDAVKRVRQMIVKMQSDVDSEESVQKMLLDKHKKAYTHAMAAATNASKAHVEQTEIFHTAERLWRAVHGEFQGAEMALAQELAISQQERTTINNVRQMMKKLESATQDTLGNCPLDKIGRVCSGQGNCHTNLTSARPVKYCKCMAGSGRTGWDCSLCKFGWKMASLDGSADSSESFCQQKYTAAVTFLQTSEGTKFSVEDLNTMVSNLQTGLGRHSSVTGSQGNGGVESLLGGLEKTLDSKEMMMRKERDNLLDKANVAERKSHAEKKKVLAMKATLNQMKLLSEKERDLYKKVLQQYTFEAPMRAKEKTLLSKIDALMEKLIGSGVAVSAAPTLLNATGAPTVSFEEYEYE